MASSIRAFNFDSISRTRSLVIVTSHCLFTSRHVSINETPLIRSLNASCTCAGSHSTTRQTISHHCKLDSRGITTKSTGVAGVCFPHWIPGSPQPGDFERSPDQYPAEPSMYPRNPGINVSCCRVHSLHFIVFSKNHRLRFLRIN
jgi:hypothetical protein